MFENVTAQNALLFAMRTYENPHCMSQQEFIEDYRKFKYVKRLCRRYVTTKRLSERLVLNHLISLANVFGVEPTVRLLFLKCEASSYKALKPFLLYLGMLPELVKGINGKDIFTDTISLDEPLYRRLRAL